MTTRTRTNNRPGSRLKTPKGHELAPLSVYPNSIEQDMDYNWSESVSHNAPSSVADMDNLVYLYLSEMGQTAKLNAREEKILGSRIEQGKYLDNLEQDINLRNGRQPLASEIFLELLTELGKSRELF
jgi:hypothetical protein